MHEGHGSYRPEYDAYSPPGPSRDDGYPSTTAGGVPDPSAGPEQQTASPRVYPTHPLFPTEDGGPEVQDIQFVTFCRQNPAGRVSYAPCVFRADYTTDWWGLVYELWGGGRYQAIAKGPHHHVLRHHPTKGEWVDIEGPQKPLVKPVEAAQNARTAAAAAASGTPPEAAQPAGPQPVLPPGVAEIVTAVKGLAEDLRGEVRGLRERVERTEQKPGGEESLLLTLLKKQFEESGADRRAMLDMATRNRDAASPAAAPDPLATLERMLGIVHKLKPDAPLAPAPQVAAQPDLFDTLERAQKLGLLGGAPTRPSFGQEIKPLADVIGGALTESLKADARVKEAEIDLRKAELQHGPRPPERAAPGPSAPPAGAPRVIYVEGYGLVPIVSREAFADLGTPRPAPAAAPSPTSGAPAPPATATAASAPTAPSPPSVIDAAPSARQETAPAPAPPPSLEVPEEMRAAVQDAAAQITDEDKRAFVELYLTIKGKGWSDRINLLSQLGPMFKDMRRADLEQFAQMMDVLPIEQIGSYAVQLGKKEVSTVLGAARTSGLLNGVAHH